MKNGIARSPLFYVGDKYKLVREIKTHFPITSIILSNHLWVVEA